MRRKTKKQSTPAPPPPPISRSWLISCVLLYTALTTLLIFRVPLGAAPDEDAHLEYVAHLATQGELPVFKPLGANHPGYEFHQPPLYYAICAPFWKIFAGGDAAKYTSRLIAMLCGAATLPLLWFSMTALFPTKRELSLIATGFVALWPMHINVGASAGPDALTGLTCAAIFFLVARGAQRYREGIVWNFRDSLMMGGVLGLSLLTKNSGLVLAPVAIGAAWMFSRPISGEDETEKPPLSPLLASILVLATIGVLAGWWWWRNTVLYGDPLAAQIFDEAFSKSSPRPIDYFIAFGEQMTLAKYLRGWFLVAFSTFWGFFGGPNTALQILNIFGSRGPRPEAFTALPLILLCLAATLFAILGLLRAARNWPHLLVSTKTALTLWIAGGVLMTLALVQFNFIQFQAQARYLHPAALPIAAAFALGWYVMWRDSPRRVLWTTSGAIFAGALLLLTLWNAFGWRTLV